MSKKNNKPQGAPLSDAYMPALPSTQPEPDRILLGGHYLPVKVDKKTQKKKGAKKEEKIKISSKGFIIKQGRHLCNCEGEMHAVITNCLHCGKIICEQEKTGPCLFCGHDVPVPLSYEQQKKDTAKATSNNPELQRAVEHRNRLIEFDKTFEERTVVIDDHIDFDESETNLWLSQEERDERRQKEEKLRELKDDRRKLMFTFDFAGRRVLVDNSKREEEISKLMQNISKSSGMSHSSGLPSVQESRAHPGVLRGKLEYTSTSSSSVGKKKQKQQQQQQQQQLDNKDNDCSSSSHWGKQLRVQHDYFPMLEEQDSEQCALDSNSFTNHISYENPSTDEQDLGMCLSMHQPWASLLVFGVKRFEGRTWSTQHRGRLWIASTREKPTPELVRQLEDMYKKMNRPLDSFPKFYPMGVLLGCVDVVQCLSQEMFAKRYPLDKEESQSDFVFVCKNPRRLVVPLEILGQPGIYPLSQDTLHRAHLGLKPLPTTLQ